MSVRRALVPLVSCAILLSGCLRAEAEDGAERAPWPALPVIPPASSAPTTPAGTQAAMPSSRPPLTPTRRPASTTRPPTDAKAPVVLRATADAAKVTISQGCNPAIPTSTTVHIFVDDPDTDERLLKVSVKYVIGQATLAGATPGYVGGSEFRTTFGPVAHDSRFGYVSYVTAVVTAVDPAGNSSGAVSLPNLFQFGDCYNG